jgi:O-antigen ligase
MQRGCLISMEVAARPNGGRASELLCSAALAAVRPLHALVAEPCLLFLATLAVMLFRPPDLQFYSLDRVAFFLLVFIVMLRALALRQSLHVTGPVTWPMLLLLLLSLHGLMAQAFDAQNWSLFAAKWVVPFALYHLAGLVFEDATSLRRLETFALLVLAYLILTAVLFLLGAKALIFPRYILDETLGIHADRARGPFLQAVANGVTLNLLGLLALNSFRRGRLRGAGAALLLTTLPLAILATRTRAVWLSFAGSVLLLLLITSSPRLRRACLVLACAGGVGLLLAVILGGGSNALGDRLEDRSPVDYRMVVYEAGWKMFLDKPVAGWGASRMQPELQRRIAGFHQDAFFMHNTYLEIGVEHGLIGLSLYAWMVVGLFGLGKRQRPTEKPADSGFLDLQFRSLWPILVIVYLVNGSFVVMNYQFVNGLLFTLAGVLAANNRRPDAEVYVIAR